jgi:sugar phosphate isomerase/epimerase
MGELWDGAYRENYSQEAYRMTVESIREIIDDVKPTRAYYTIEPMPWMVPDGPDPYVKLIEDVDRAQFGAHLDYVNMINSPHRALFAEEFIEECLKKLAPYVKSCHAKDIKLHEGFTAMIEEVRPGTGQLDYAVVLRALDKYLLKDVPVLLEHMHTDEEYKSSFDYLRAIAARARISV